MNISAQSLIFFLGGIAVGAFAVSSSVSQQIRDAQVKTFDEVYDMFRNMDESSWIVPDKKD